MTSPTAELRALGTFTLQIDGRSIAAPSTQKARALLVYLILHQDSECSREGLVERFWPDIEPERSRQSLNTAVWSIRKQIHTAGLDPASLFSVGKVTLRWIAPTMKSLTEASRCGQRSAEPQLGRRADQVYILACLYAHKYAEARIKADEIVRADEKTGREGAMAWTSRSCASFFFKRPWCCHCRCKPGNRNRKPLGATRFRGGRLPLLDPLERATVAFSRRLGSLRAR